MPRMQIRERRSNRAKMLEAMQMHGTMTRSELSGACGIRRTSVGSIAQELLAEGLVAECEPGHPRSALRLDPRGRRFALALELTPAAVRGARVRLDGTLDRTAVRPLHPPKPEKARANAVAAAVTALAKKLAGGAADAILGTALAVSGVVDEPRGTVVRSARLWQWQNLELGAALGAGPDGAPVRIVNDTFAQLWDNAWFGRDLSCAGGVFYLGIGDGLSCASLVHGRPVTGLGCAAGEIGHVRAGDEGRVCSCGKADCLECYANAPAILAELAKVMPSATWDSLTAAAAAYGRLPPVAAVVDRVAVRLARQLAPVLAALAPEKVLVGTDEPRFSARLAEHLQRHAEAELLGVPAGRMRFAAAESLRDATLRGAGAWVIARAFRAGGGVQSAGDGG